MAAASKLEQRAAEIAAQFVQTVVLIDDEAYSLFKSTDQGQFERAELTIHEPGLLPGDELASPSDSASTPSVDDKEEKPLTEGFDRATEADFSQGVNSRNIVANFARRGLVCGIIEPNPDGSDLDGLLLAAVRSDVLIVDWVFNKDKGARAKEIIKKVLSDGAGRLRLIIVYTGDTALEKIAKDIAAVIPDLTSKKNVLYDERTRIVVLQKAQHQRRDGVSVEQLPDRVLTEFAALYSGLVTLVAVEGLSKLRGNTHLLLARLRKHLDSAYLAHRMLLPRPEDAQDFLTDLVGQEIAAMLQSYEIGRVADLSAVIGWLEASGSKMSKDCLELVRKIGYDGDPRKELVEYGVEKFLKKQCKDEEKIKTIERDIHRSGSKIFIEDRRKADDADQEFAHVSSMISLYDSSRLPRLTLGTVLETSGGTYLVCIQPVCDCVRIKGKRRFSFLQGRRDSAPNLILRDGGKSIRLKVESKSTALVQYEFEPQDGADVVCSSRTDEKSFTFTSGAERFTWRGQFKFAQAQRIAQRFGSSLARVGLDESEWLRRFDR